MGLFKSIKKVVKKVAKPALSVGGAILGQVKGLPGWVGPAATAAGSFLSSNSAAKQATDLARQNAEAQAAVNASNEALQREFHAKNEALQREFAQSGIRWRVQDAKAAGLHPLFALSGNTLGYSPSTVVGGQAAYQGSTVAEPHALGSALSEMGQNLSRAQAAQQTTFERQAQDLQLQQLAASVRKDFAIASYYESEAMRAGANTSAIALPYTSGLSFPKGTPLPAVGPSRGSSSSSSSLTGSVEVTPDQVVSALRRDRSQTAGTKKPLWEQYRLEQGGVPIDLPKSSDPGEMLSEMGFDLGTWLMLKRNVERYGWKWLDDAFIPGWRKNRGGATGSW